MSEGRSRQVRAFGAALGVAALLFVTSIVVYHGGGRTETARQVGAGFKWAANILVAVAVLMRWKGPWREPKD